LSFGPADFWLEVETLMLWCLHIGGRSYFVL
jgi:hypothetical protein